MQQGCGFCRLHGGPFSQYNQMSDEVITAICVLLEDGKRLKDMATAAPRSHRKSELW
jgi:hypothetical protein